MYTGQPGCTSRRQGCRLCRPLGHPKNYNYNPIESCQYISIQLNTSQYHTIPYSTIFHLSMSPSRKKYLWLILDVPRIGAVGRQLGPRSDIDQRGHLQIFTVHLISNMHLCKVLWLLCPTEICKGGTPSYSTSWFSFSPAVHPLTRLQIAINHGCHGYSKPHKIHIKPKVTSQYWFKV